MHIDDFMVMYGIYSAETLEKIITIVHEMCNITTPNEWLFAGKLRSSFTGYLTKEGVNHYAIHSVLYLRMLREKYVKMYAEFITQLHMYGKVIRILSKGYLPISFIPPSKLQEILNAVKKAIWTMNLDYDIVIKRLHLYYDMKLVTFGIGRDQNLITEFPVLIKPYMQQPLILY